MFALVAVLMPMSWMVAIHRWLGLGDMPTDRIVGYLARSLSAFYVFTGALCLVVSSDLERFSPLACFLGLAFFFMGAVATGIDFAVGMPWWWSYFEGPPAVLLGVFMYFLARSENRKRDDPAAAAW